MPRACTTSTSQGTILPVSSPLWLIPLPPLWLIPLPVHPSDSERLAAHVARTASELSLRPAAGAGDGRPAGGGGHRALHRPLPQGGHRAAGRGGRHRHPRPPGPARGARPAPRGDPQLAPGAQPAHRRAAGPRRGGRDPGRPGRRLPALPPQAPHPGHDRPRAGPGAPGAGPDAPGPGDRPAARGRSRYVTPAPARASPSAARAGRRRGPPGRPGRHRRVGQRRRRRPRPHPAPASPPGAPCARRCWPARSEAGAKFRDYFDWSEPVAGAPSHRVLAIRRGAAEGRPHLLRPPARGRGPGPPGGPLRHRRRPGAAPRRCAWRCGTGTSASWPPALETEARAEAKERADGAAIDVFARNLRQLLLAPPLGQRRVLAIDPGFRTGCKIGRPGRPGPPPAPRRRLPGAGASSARGEAREHPHPPGRSSTRSRPSPSATAPPGARRRPSCAGSACPRPCPS